MMYRLPHSTLLRYLLVACVLVVSLCTRLSGQAARPVENIALLDSLAGVFSTSFMRDMGPDGYTGFRLTFSEHPAAERLRRLFPAHDAATSANDPLLQYYISDFAVRYLPYDDDTDSLVREASLSLNSNTATPRQKSLPSYTLKLRDTVARDDLPFIESNQFDFGRAPIPDKPSDFYSDIAEPLIVVSAAVITVLLLFTVRSQ